MSSNLFSTQNIVMGILISGMAWGGVTITELKARAAVNTNHTSRVDSIIPEINRNLAEIKTDIKYVKHDIVEIKQSQKDYQKDFNKRLDSMK